jgi:hypothetical protein
MSFAFRSSYAKLTDKSGIWLRLEDLDDNDRYRTDVESAQGPEMMKPLYERLLGEWERSVDKSNLTREDFLRIQRAIGTMPSVTAAFQTEAGELPAKPLWRWFGFPV